MLNNFNEKQIKDIDNTTKAQFSNLNVNNNIFLVASGDGNAPPSSDARWDFNDGSGTTIVSALDSNNLTVSGTGYTWGTGYFQTVSGATAWAGPVNFLSQVDNFSYFLWTSINSVAATGTRYYLTLGNGSSNANLSTTLFTTTAAKVNCIVVATDNSQTTISIPTTTFSPANDEKFLVCFTYTRIGGATNNNMRVRVTKDGVNWYEASNVGGARLMRKSNLFSWRSNATALSTTSYNRYYRFGIYNNKVLSNSEMQLIWNLGSEATAEQYQAILNSTNQQPAALLIGNKLYSNTSSVNCTISGDLGAKDIFAIGQMNGTFTLNAVDRNTSPPNGSRYIGTGTLSETGFVINRSLSSEIEKEMQTTSTITNTIVLNTLTVSQYENVLVYVNGLIQDSTVYSITGQNEITFNSNLAIGDQVTVVKFKNQSSFIRPS